MIGTVLNFNADPAEHPSNRVTEFITLARSIQALIPSEAWDLDVWPVGGSFLTKGENRVTRVLAFYNCEAILTNRQELIGGAPLGGAFREFAKAYIRYMHSTSKVTFENASKRLDALQFIEAGFRSHNLVPIIENLNVNVLNAAVCLAKDGVGAARHYQFASCIQQVYRFCLERKFLVAPFQWKHGVRKPKDRTEAMGQEAKDWRSKKLPSPEAYHALAHIYRHSETFVDRLYSAVTAIIVAVPIRIHEVLQLREDCEIYDKVKDPESGKMQDTYGIRVFPGKENPPHVKWVSTSMTLVVQEAVARIRELCADARAVAEWYEAHPSSLYLPESIEKIRESNTISLSAVRQLTGVVSDNKALQLLRHRGVDLLHTSGAQEKGVRFCELERQLLNDLPHEFPYLNGERSQRYSKTLILLFLHQAHAQKSTNPSLVEKASTRSYAQWLAGHDGGRKPSVFQRWKFTERDGSPIQISSHSFRHWLNTVAQLKGMSDLDIAKWSGREVQQNKAYNHVTPEETLSQIRGALDDGSGVGPMFEAGRMVGVKTPVDRREFMQARIGAALTTELGICIHDYSILPCQMHGDCLGCSENIFIKGDAVHREKISNRHDMTSKQLDGALKAMAADYHGADRWVQSHQASIARMEEMLTIHDDPNIPDGTVISLRGASRDGELAMALRDRDAGFSPANPADAVANRDGTLLDAILVDMWED
ncbi:MAG: hypothetical protein H2046_01280 [Rhizobiales bacterium]|nr:hypothetical protein [Hyphomicrobiales bacterium]